MFFFYRGYNNQNEVVKQSNDRSFTFLNYINKNEKLVMDISKSYESY